MNEIDRSDLRRQRRRRRRIIVLSLLLVVATGLTIAFRNPLFRKNFGVVAPGLVYRSAQPGANLEDLVKAWKLTAILNLRGGSASDGFYSNEVRLSNAKDIDFYDFPMSATQRPRRRDLLILIDLFERCRYPILIHCKSGSDRTGLASALYRMVRLGIPPEQALNSFSLFYGHVPLFGPQHLHEPFHEYAAWLKSEGVTHSPERFRGWVEHDYQADDPLKHIPPLRSGPRSWLRHAARH